MVATNAPPEERPSSRIDAEGRWREHAPLSAAVVGFYLALILLLLFLGRTTGPSVLPYPLFIIVAMLVVYLLRYASTTYTMDSDRLLAWRLFGSRAIPLEEIRRIELANLRDLGSVSFFGGWGWRGRSWSPVVGTFDSLHTMSAGVLLRAGPVPLFISPKDPIDFARELSRRVRSYTEGVEHGPGILGPTARTGGSVGGSAGRST